MNLRELCEKIFVTSWQFSNQNTLSGLCESLPTKFCSSGIFSAIYRHGLISYALLLCMARLCTSLSNPLLYYQVKITHTRAGQPAQVVYTSGQAPPSQAYQLQSANGAIRVSVAAGTTATITTSSGAAVAMVSIANSGIPSQLQLSSAGTSTFTAGLSH